MIELILEVIVSKVVLQIVIDWQMFLFPFIYDTVFK